MDKLYFGQENGIWYEKLQKKQGEKHKVLLNDCKSTMM